MAEYINEYKDFRFTRNVLDRLATFAKASNSDTTLIDPVNLLLELEQYSYLIPTYFPPPHSDDDFFPEPLRESERQHQSEEPQNHRQIQQQRLLDDRAARQQVQHHTEDQNYKEYYHFSKRRDMRSYLKYIPLSDYMTHDEKITCVRIFLESEIPQQRQQQQQQSSRAGQQQQQQQQSQWLFAWKNYGMSDDRRNEILLAICEDFVREYNSRNHLITTVIDFIDNFSKDINNIICKNQAKRSSSALRGEIVPPTMSALTTFVMHKLGCEQPVAIGVATFIFIRIAGAAKSAFCAESRQT